MPQVAKKLIKETDQKITKAKKLSFIIGIDLKMQMKQNLTTLIRVMKVMEFTPAHVKKKSPERHKKVGKGPKIIREMSRKAPLRKQMQI